jgi:TRAP-type C4-dicarboxylate transport system permease small subunit
MQSLYVRSVALIMRGVRTVIAVLLIASVLLNLANIIGRYAFHAPIVGAEEVMMFLMIGVVFLGASVVAFDSEHISMEIALDALPGGVRGGLRRLIDLVCCAVAATMIWIGVPVVEHLAQFHQRSEAANVPLAIPQAAVPLGFALLVLAIVARRLD